MTSIRTLKGIYDTRLITLSVFIAVLAAYAGTDLAGRIIMARGTSRRLWFFGGSIALGVGVWATRYTMMEGVYFAIPIAYDWPTVLDSLIASTLTATAGLYVVSRPVTSLTRTFVGTCVVATGYAVMQYQAVQAMRLQARFSFTPYSTMLFILVACAVSYLGLRLTIAFRDTGGQWSWKKCLSLLLLGVCLPLMSLVGSAAVRFTHSDTFNGGLQHAISLSSLDSLTVSMASLLVLVIVFLSSTVGRRFSQQALQLLQSEAQLQAIFDNMQEGIVVVDRSLKVVQVNRAARRLFALTDKQIAYPELREYLGLLQPNGAPLPPELWPSALAFKGQFLQDHEVQSRRKVDGKLQVLEVSSAPILNRDGEVTQIIVSYRDITRQKTLDLARARLAAIVESSEDAIIGKDANGIVTSWNFGAEKIFGYAAEEILGHSIRRLIPADLEREEDEILGQINRGITVDHIETVRRRKDGELIHVSLTISPIRDQAGQIIGASKIARDITERRQLERQLRQSHKMEALGQLTGGIAHDFNNLLGVILGNLDLLATLVDGNQPALKRVHTAQKAVTHGAELTRRMLMFSRKEDLRPRPASLEESVRNMIELAGRGIGPEIRITPHFDPAVPLVFVDVAGLESALLNLVVNARDAMPRGGTVTISTHLSLVEENYPPVQAGELKPGTYACVSVSDTGHGMTREILDRVFEPFFTTKARNKGTGLGLSMVYGFVKQSGGTVRVYSEPGYGTTVSFYLPLAHGTAELAAPVVNHVESSCHSGSVLVVDDEEDLLEIAVAYLHDMGYSTLQAANGAAALEILQTQSVDLLITDIIMPGGMNGVELVQHVRALYPSTRIIYCSGFPADALAERSLPLIDGPLLRKPYHRAEFGTSVRGIMDDHASIPTVVRH